MKQLEFRACPYKAVDAKGRRNVIYRIYEGDTCIAAFHEDVAKPYIGAVVRQHVMGNHTTYSAQPFKTEPTLHNDVYGVAYLKDTDRCTNDKGCGETPCICRPSIT